jgi:hypothetical protein
MRKTKRFAPLISGLLIIIFLSVRINDKLLVESIFGEGLAVLMIVLLYSVAVYVIIKGLTMFTREFDMVLDRLIHVLHSGFRRFNDV